MIQKVLATYRGGRFECDSSVDWPDGTRVEVIPLRPRIGMSESDWPETPEGIQALLDRMDAAVRPENEPIDFNSDWPEWDQFQTDATRKSWDDAEKLF